MESAAKLIVSKELTEWESAHLQQVGKVKCPRDYDMAKGGHTQKCARWVPAQQRKRQVHLLW